MTTQFSIPDPAAQVSQSPRRFDFDASRRLFEQDGYVLFKNVVSKEMLTHLHRALVDEFEHAGRAGKLPAGGGAIAGHLNCFPGEAARFAYDSLVDSGIVNFIKGICPRPFSTPNVGCNFNLPKSIVQHYHADGCFTEQFMIANVAVVDTNLDNGAIEVSPGTHREFYKFWRFVWEGHHRAGKRLSMNQGDVLVRTSILWHRGMPNRTKAPRPMIAMTFGEPQNEVQRRDPFAVNDGKIMFYENWYRTNRLGRLRERTFVVAPWTYDTYRFARSLVGNKGYATP